MHQARDSLFDLLLKSSQVSYSWLEKPFNLMAIVCLSPLHLLLNSYCLTFGMLYSPILVFLLVQRGIINATVGFLLLISVNVASTKSILGMNYINILYIILLYFLTSEYKTYLTRSWRQTCLSPIIMSISFCTFFWISGYLSMYKISKHKVFLTVSEPAKKRSNIKAKNSSSAKL